MRARRAKPRLIAAYPSARAGREVDARAPGPVPLRWHGHGTGRTDAGPRAAGPPPVAVLSACTAGSSGCCWSSPAAEVLNSKEVRHLVHSGTRAGVFHPDEPAMVEGVLARDRLPVRDLITPTPGSSE